MSCKPIGTHTDHGLRLTATATIGQMIVLTLKQPDLIEKRGVPKGKVKSRARAARASARSRPRRTTTVRRRKATRTAARRRTAPPVRRSRPSKRTSRRPQRPAAPVRRRPVRPVRPGRPVRRAAPLPAAPARQPHRPPARPVAAPPSRPAAPVPTAPPIHVLTYNVFFKSMSSKATGCANQVCARNIARAINDAAASASAAGGQLDFVALQEASTTGLLDTWCPSLQQMTKVLDVVRVEEAAVYFNPRRWNLSSRGVGNTAGPGRHQPIGSRPMQLLVFGPQRVLFINAHMHHYQNPQFLLDDLGVTVAEVLQRLHPDTAPQIWNQFRIIMAGDLNYQLKRAGKTVRLTALGLTRMLHLDSSGGHVKTCCGDEARLANAKGALSKQYDHILDTLEAPRVQVQNFAVPASDHAPLLGTLRG